MMYIKQLTQHFLPRRLIGYCLIGCYLLAVSVLVGCGGNSDFGGEPVKSSSSSVSSSFSSQSSASAESVTLSGLITFDSVKPTGSALRFYSDARLDYNAVTRRPARGVVVQLLDASDTIVDSGVTDAKGRYSFTVTPGTSLKVRTRAQLASNQYTMIVRDNTNSDREYVLDGSLASVGSVDQGRDLNAALGWDASQNRYVSQRQSAPFAILDVLYDAVQKIIAAEPGIVLPPLDIFWSVNNTTNSGSIRDGNIGTSYYFDGDIFILGAADSDTDEFDQNVIAHEFGHYIEDNLSRSESPGGNHTQTQALDMRLAMGEGFGNAFSAMVTGAPYLDTFNAGQQDGFGFDLETNSRSQAFYTSGAVQTVLYDLYDSVNDVGDSVSLGFGAIFNTLRDPAYRNFDGFISIFTFLEVIKSRHVEELSAINTLASTAGIFGQGFYGDGETQNAKATYTLPVYHTLVPGQALEVCGINKLPDFNIWEYNSFAVNRFVLLDIPNDGSYTIRVERSRGLTVTDPDFEIYRRGTLVSRHLSSQANLEATTRQLTAGTYVMSIAEAANTDENESTGGLACFQVSLN